MLEVDFCLPDFCNLPRLIAMEDEVVTAKQLVQRAHGWRAQLERCQMRIADLEADKERQAQRRWELVGSYWPLMKRLREAQQVAVLLFEQVGFQCFCLSLAFLDRHFIRGLLDWCNPFL